MLLQNAMQFARRRVTVDISLKDDEVRLRLLDDGPGFEEALIDSLGEPYFSTGAKGREDGGHMGLGLFIARTFLERRGANLVFGNQRVDDGQGRRSVAGAEVVVTWPRRSLDPDAA
jgi:two-component system sensor histidine kinase RegB